MSKRPTTQAVYESRCAYCDEQIEEGDMLGLLEPGGDWVHERCAESEPWPGEA